MTRAAAVALPGPSFRVLTPHQAYVGIAPVNYLTADSEYDGMDSFGSVDTPLGKAVRQTIATG